MMYEGKNIHYSPLDNKPLCSYSGKLCKQRRLNGYALCLRHVLEDPAAPFRQCTYTARNKQQCTNPIHQSNTSQFCTSHMQLLGLLPVASKSAGKVMKNGQHGGDGHVKQLTAVIASLDTHNNHMSVATDPYSFHETEIKCKISDAVTDAAIKNAQFSKPEQVVGDRVRSIPIARLYPELAEKLEKPDSSGFKLLQVSDSSLLKTSMAIVSCLQSVNNQTVLAGQSKLKERTRRTQNVKNNVAKLSQPRLSTNSTSTIKSCIGSTVVSSNILQSATLNCPKNGAYAVATSAAGLSQWRLPANSQVSSALPVNNLLSDALRGLLSSTTATTSLTQQQSILRTLFPNLLSYASCGIGTSVVTSIHSDHTESPTTAKKPLENVESTPIPPAPSLAEPSNSSIFAASTHSKEPCNEREVQPSIPCLVRPKRLSRHSIERNLRKKLARRSSLKVCLDHLERLDYNSDILPFGVDSSEDDSDLELELPRQRYWSTLSSDDEEQDTDVADDVASNIRRTKLLLQKSKKRRQFLELQNRFSGNACLRKRQAAADLALIDAARRCPVAAAEAVEAMKDIRQRSRPVKRNSFRLRDDVQSKYQCCLYKNGDDVLCGNVCLPYTNHCLKHIMYNVDQQLYGYCTAKFVDGTQCCEPVFDIEHELPLCHEHSSKAEIHQHIYQDPKPKKQRKKTKPSALTRPPKKGKKKKQKPRKGFLCPTTCLSSDVNDCVDATGEPMAACAAITSSSSVSVPQPRSSKSDITIGRDALEDDSLDLDEQLFPGAIERNLGLPMDTDQATKFLDEHDLQDVLNKMPDEAFDLLSGKNEEYSLSKEDDEALNCVLTGVSKPFENYCRNVRFTHGVDHPSSRGSDGCCALPDDELMKHITSVLFSRNSLSPTSLEDFPDNIGDVTGELSSNDFTQILTESANQLNDLDCDSFGSSSVESSFTSSIVASSSVQPLQNGFTCHSITQTSSSFPLMSFVSSAAFPFVTVSLPSAATLGRTLTSDQTVIVSAVTSATSTRCMKNVPLLLESARLRPSQASAAAITPSCTTPVIQIGSLPRLQQLLRKESVSSLLTTASSAAPIVRGASPLTSQLPTLIGSQQLMKQSWRFVFDQRPPLTVASSDPRIPLGGVFQPFATAYCSLPQASSSVTPVLKMGHPLAGASAMNSNHVISGGLVSLPPCGSISLLSPASSLLLSSSLSSSAVRLAANTGQTMFLPTTVACPSVDQKSFSNS